jgi:hypothetical protein
MSALQHTRTCLLCRPPARSPKSAEELLRETTALLRELATGGDWAPQRDRAWLLSEQARLAELAGQLDHARALRCYDLIGAIWGMCERASHAWREIEEGRGSPAMDAAGRMAAHLDTIEEGLGGERGAIERIRGRGRAIWHVADALDEAAFLTSCGDHDSARDRAAHLLEQAAELEQRGVLSPDEREATELAAARWGARPRAHRTVSWAC